MRHWVIVVAAALALGGCSHVRLGTGVPDSIDRERILASTADPADSAYVREMTEFIKIIDPKYWKSDVRPAANATEFRARIEEYFAGQDRQTRPDTPHRNEWREEMERRIAYCREKLLSTIDAPIRDVRWELILRFGIPSWTYRAIDTAMVDTYFLKWDSLGVEITCQTLKVGGPPVALRPYHVDVLAEIAAPLGGLKAQSPRARMAAKAGMSVDYLKATAEELQKPPAFAPFPGLKQVIHSNLAPLVFPNADGTSDLWIATLTRGDQFSDSTLARDRLGLELIVYDQRQQLIGQDSCTIGGLAQLQTLSEREAVAIPGYVGLRGLAPGPYEFVLSLRGGGPDNIGVYRDTVTIPTRRALRGASDVVVAFAPGTVRGGGIPRHGRLIHANPSGRFAPRDSLELYVEFPLAEIPDSAYRVTVSLIPQGSPLFSGRMSRRERVLQSAIYPREALAGVFQGDVPLADVPRGRYFLSVQVASRWEDPAGEKPVMAWTEIEVK
jgi:hypothetical protein